MEKRHGQYGRCLFMTLWSHRFPRRVGGRKQSAKILHGSFEAIGKPKVVPGAFPMLLAQITTHNRDSWRLTVQEGPGGLQPCFLTRTRQQV